MRFLKSITPTDQHVRYLDGLRGIAVLMVLGHHAAFYFKREFSWNYLRPWIDSGFRGVPLFFILSAFTLFASSTIRFSTETRPIVSFFLRRAFRILPFFWLNVAYKAFLVPTPFINILANLTFVYGFLIPTPQLYMVPGSWSLAVEETFYLIFPLIFVKFLKDLHWVIFGLLFFVLVKILWQHLMLANGYTSDLQEFWGSPFNNYYWFFVGILLAHFQLAKGQNKLMKDDQIKMPLIFDALVIISMAFLNRFDDLTVAVAFCFLVLTASFSNTLTGRLCRSRVLGLFGISCYSIYFIHFYVLVWLDPYLKKEFSSHLYQGLSAEAQFVFYTFLVAAISLAFGLVSFILFEVPSVKIGASIIAKIKANPSRT